MGIWKALLEAEAPGSIPTRASGAEAGWGSPALPAGSLDWFSPGAPQKQPGAGSPLPGHLLEASGDQVQAPHWCTQAEMCSHLAAHTGFCYTARLPLFVLGRMVLGWNSHCRCQKFTMAAPRSCSPRLAQPPDQALPSHQSVDTSPAKGWAFERRTKILL